MNYLRSVSVLWIGVILLSSGSLSAQDDKVKTDKPKSKDFLQSVFYHFDKNKDGKLTKSELPEALHDSLSSVDRDRDGIITWTELRRKYPRGFTSSREQWFEDVDANGDGKLDKKELGTQWGRLATYDTNKDDKITKAEYLNRFSRTGGFSTRSFERYDKNNDGKLTQKEVGFRWRTYQRYDKNNDGVVTKAEYVAGRGRVGFGARDPQTLVDTLFERTDTNKDGVITEKEAGSRWSIYKRADADNDGKLTKKEMLDVYNRNPFIRPRDR